MVHEQWQIQTSTRSNSHPTPVRENLTTGILSVGVLCTRLKNDFESRQLQPL